MVLNYIRSEVEMASSAKKLGTKEQHELMSKAG